MLPRGGSNALLAAALRVGADTRVLRPGRFRLLHLAWVQGLSLAAIGRLTQVASIDAMRQRVLRASDVVEVRLAAEVATIIGDPDSRPLLLPRQSNVTVREDLLRALEILVLA